MKRPFLLFLMLLTAAGVSAQKLLTSAYADRLDSLLAPPQQTVLLSGGKHCLADSLPSSVRESYAAYAGQFAGRSWVSLPVTVFAEYKKSGNRTHYEQLCFDKRRQLAALVMGEAVERKGRFTSAIADGIQSLCEETWWGIPAHYKTEVPQTENQEVDLFNAETAGLLAWTRYVLADELNRCSPLLTRRIDSELQRRMLQPALKGKYWWKTAGMNWNPWICSNWLACVLVGETDRQRQVEAVRSIMQCLDAFIDAYPADGGCDEGPGYWDRAAASLFDCLYLLHRATGGRIDVRQNPKVRAMMAYIYKMYIGNGYYVNFADAHSNRMQAQLNAVLPMACYCGDRRLEALAASMLPRWQQDAAALYSQSGNFPTLGRELNMLELIGQGLDMQEAAGRVRQKKETQWHDSSYLPDLQIATFRRGQLYAAVKGGTNGESHNHNDVGSFIVYADQEPLLIDPGVGEYTAKTFSRQRYDIWTMQSQYHNLPTINGQMQRDGKQYHATRTRCKDGSMQLDIAAAYPAEALVKRWTRRVAVGTGAVAVTDDYELSAFVQPSTLNLVCTVRPVADGNGCLRLGKRRLEYDARQLSAEVDDISPLLDETLRSQWGAQMYRIRLVVKGSKLKNSIRYYIK